MMKIETIAAFATAPGNSGIGIIRVSGPDAILIVDRIFKSKSKRKKLESVKTHTIHYGYIYDAGEVIDEVLITVLRGPNSFTKEDTVEINCHGGMIVMRKILDTVIHNGCRLAEPGEFTKKAFLNGRIDLSQAEAVMDLINAKNHFSRRSSISQLSGSVSEEIKDLRSKIIYYIAFIESALDDPEHVSLDGFRGELSIFLDETRNRLNQLISSAENGRILTEGIKTVILGKPNVGKSSLLNVLLGTDRAIVTEIAGTTRDTLEESLNVNGVQLNIVDTAGIRESEDIVEQIGVDRARSAALDADLILYVVDGSTALDEDDELILSIIMGKKVIVVLNKMDLNFVYSTEELELKMGYQVIPISAKKRLGIDKLYETINSMFICGELDFNDELIITNVRHKKALEDALFSIDLVKRSIEDGMPEDFYSIDLNDSYQSLGSIIGEAVEDDLINEIFSKFCVGK